MDAPENKYTAGQVLYIDKAAGWTSFDVVKKLRFAIKNKYNLKKIKVGHAGTLDPLATGLVIICTGKKTKEIEKYQAQKKEYIAEFFIGAQTPSYDLETEITARFPTEHISSEKIFETAQKFIGKQMQIPPIFSAKQINGKRAYKIARAGLKPEMKAREIEIFEFEILETKLPLVKARISCSKGTYIRSIAYDFGKYLKSGGYLHKLRRTKIGDFDVSNAKTIDIAVKMLYIC